MILKPVYSVPRGMSPPDVHWLPNHLLLEYYRDRKPYHSVIDFDHVIAVQNRDNYHHAAPWHPQEEYVLVEVTDSPWKQQLLDEMAGKHDQIRRSHHYAFKTRDDGTFDFVAGGWELRPEREGCPSKPLLDFLDEKTFED